MGKLFVPEDLLLYLAQINVYSSRYSNSFMAMLNNRTFIKQDILRNQMGGSSGSRQQWSVPAGPPASVVPLTTSSFTAENDHSGTFTMSDIKVNRSVHQVSPGRSERHIFLIYSIGLRLEALSGAHKEPQECALVWTHFHN